ASLSRAAHAAETGKSSPLFRPDICGDPRGGEVLDDGGVFRHREPMPARITTVYGGTTKIMEEIVGRDSDFRRTP
ncbi:MAG: hypothetical protein NT132_09360, partial [Microbacterium sp.]|uniref:hypothetical protein n=1 Tax=Microbacterium sp. TaxID=51671 RepID=UPI00263524BF